MTVVINNHQNLNILKISIILIFSLIQFNSNAQSSQQSNCIKQAVEIAANGKCQYESFKFDADLIANATYSWDVNGDGVVDYSGVELTSVEHAFASTGKFTVQLNIALSDCSKIFTKSINVSSVARPVFDISQECETIYITNYTSAYDSIIWLLSDGTQLSKHSFTHTFKKDGVFEVELKAFKNGCELNKVKDVEIKRVKADAVISSTKICAPATISFSTDSNQVKQAKWYFNKELVSTEANFDKAFDEASIYEVSLSVRNEQGCFDSTKKAIKVELTEPIKTNFSIDNDKICTGNNVIANDLSNNADKRTWIWSDGETVNNKKEINREFNKAGTYDLTIISSRNSDACTDTFLQKNAVTVYESPKANFSLSNTTGCLPLDIKIDVNNSGFATNQNLILNRIDTLDYSNGNLTINQSGVHELSMIMTNSEASCQSEYSVKVRVFDTLSTKYAPKVINLTVLDDEAVSLSWSGLANVSEYSVYRESNTTSELVATSADTTFTEFLDDLDSNSYNYYIKAKDKCGYFSGLSDLANNINLLGTYAEDSFPTLRWTEFFGWKEGVNNYEVQKQMNGNWETVAETEVPYFIDRSFDNNNALEATYRVIAHSAENDAQAVSNSWSFEFEPNIFIPSAFTPNHDNLNDKYTITAFGFERLDVLIFNSWGQKVYDSNGQNAEWDGTFNGNIVDEGVYICVVKVETPNGRTYDFENTVTIIK